MTNSGSFLPENFINEQRDLQLKMNSAALASAAFSIVVAGCGASTLPESAPTSAPIENNIRPASEGASSSMSSASAVSGAPAPSQQYADGTYEATGHYKAPSGDEIIDVSVTMKQGIITDTSVTAHTNNERSEKFQQLFIDGYKTYVVGKSIDEVSLDVVNGSSLTPMGFMDALKQVEAQAAK